MDSRFFLEVGRPKKTWYGTGFLFQTEQQNLFHLTKQKKGARDDPIASFNEVLTGFLPSRSGVGLESGRVPESSVGFIFFMADFYGDAVKNIETKKREIRAGNGHRHQTKGRRRFASGGGGGGGGVAAESVVRWRGARASVATHCDAVRQRAPRTPRTFSSAILWRLVVVRWLVRRAVPRVGGLSASIWSRRFDRRRGGSIRRFRRRPIARRRAVLRRTNQR